MTGASADADRAGGPTDLSRSASQPEALIPSAGNGEPDWYEVAKGLANAIMFNRATRKEHVVGKDGRVRMGIVDLFACYCIDDAAREFCEMAGLPFGDVDVPNEHQAFFMSVTGRSWSDWFTDRDAIVAGAGPSPGHGKVDMNLIAQAMSAGTAKTEGLGGDSPASAVRQDAPETQDLSTPLPSGSIER